MNHFLQQPMKRKTMTKTTRGEEKAKYKEMWSNPRYREYSPGERLVDFFLSYVNVSAEYTVADFGCGTGRAITAIGRKSGAKTIGVDIASNCLDEGVSPDEMIIECLWSKKLDVPCDVVYCTDVLEHIPPEHIDAVLENIRRSAKHNAFLQICTQDASFGRKEGHILHLTVHPLSWWKDKLNEYFILGELSAGNTGFHVVCTPRETKED